MTRTLSKVTNKPQPFRKAKLSVLLENPIFPPYRHGFFRALSRSSTCEITFTFGQASADSALRDADETSGMIVSKLHNVYVRSGKLLTVQLGLLRVMRRRNWDAIIASYDPRLILNLAMFTWAKLKGVPFIWWGHGVRPRKRFPFIYRAMAMQAQACILYSGQGKARLVELGIPEEKLFVAWNSIDTNEIFPLSSSDWSDRFRILYVGRLIPDKKVDLLIRGFSQAIKSLPKNVTLTIVGEGPELDSLKSLAEREQILDRVEWVPATYENLALAPIFNETALCVSPSYVGLSAIHSLAFGVPVLYADNELHSPEVEALETGVNCDVFRAGDAQDLGARLVRLVSEPNELQRLGKQGQDMTGLKFSNQAMVAVFESAINYACGIHS